MGQRSHPCAIFGNLARWGHVVAGNSYWNNIKQVGEVITLNGSYNDATHASYKVGIKNNDPQDTLHIGDEANNRAGTLRLAGFANNEYWRLETGTNTLGFKDYNDTQLLSLNGATDSVQVHNNLGVGTAPAAAGTGPNLDVRSATASVNIQSTTLTNRAYISIVNKATNDFLYLVKTEQLIP